MHVPLYLSKCGSITPLKFNIAPDFSGAILNFRGVISWFLWKGFGSKGFFGLFIWKIASEMLRNQMDVLHEHGALRYIVSLNQEVTMFKLDMRSVQVPGSQNKNKQLSHAKINGLTFHFTGCLGILVSWFTIIPTELGSIIPIYPKQPGLLSWLNWLCFATNCAENKDRPSKRMMIPFHVPCSFSRRINHAPNFLWAKITKQS